MKKILLTLSIFALTICANAQKEVVFNEFVPDPNVNQGFDEYIELYNTTGNAINLDCWTIVAYDFTSASGGVWVYNLPDVTITPFGFVVFAADKGVKYKCAEFDSANIYNWNLANVTASLTHYDRDGSNNLINPTTGLTTDFITIDGGPTAALAIMLFDGTGELVNGFFTNNGTTVPTEITTLNGLNISLPSTGNTCGSATLNFAGISAPEAEVLSVNQAVGNNNNYWRERDGFCGTWDKGQTCNNPLAFTPGKKNSALPPINTSTAINIVALQQGCNSLGQGVTAWNIGVTITDAGLLPATVRIYSDNDFSGGLSAGDGAAVVVGSVVTANVQTNFLAVPIKTGASAIVQVVTASGCIQVTQAYAASCSPLPVSFRMFTATRMSSNVLLRWETAWEQNNSGFIVERNVSGVWEEIAFVPTLAAGGNSDVVLSYTYIDANNMKGITQYRIRQVDIDGKYKYTEIRSVRGEGQLGKTIVYPNPSSDGRVNILFEDASATRNVTVTDMSGRLIKEYRGITNNNLTIENLPTGMFMIRIVVPETGEQVVNKVFVNK